MSQPDPFQSRTALAVGGRSAVLHSLPAFAKHAGVNLDRLPFSIRVLLENAIRHVGRGFVTEAHVLALGNWTPAAAGAGEIPFMPARVVLQDFTGVPCVVDLAAMRDAMARMGGDPARINPVVPCDLVIDHSVQVDYYGSADAFSRNVALEFERNAERYQLLKFAQRAFENFRVVPPGTGIVHQVNLEYLSPCIQLRDQYGELTAYPDTLVGTDSHTTMINGLGVMGWGVGGIEAEAVMLGQPYFMRMPEVIGMKLTGTLPAGCTATDLVLTVTQRLRARGVVDKFVEFFGPGLAGLPLADRATIANMAPEYGATMGFFPVDAETVRYLERTGRDPETVAMVEAYCRAQGLWRTADTPDPVFSDVVELDLNTVMPSVAGPKRPQDLVALRDLARNFATSLPGLMHPTAPAERREQAQAALAQWSNEGGATATVVAPSEQICYDCELDGEQVELHDGSVVIAAITSCTNTSNPSVMIGAGLLAQEGAWPRACRRRPWVKTSLAPGSRVVTDYLDKAGLHALARQPRLPDWSATAAPPASATAARCREPVDEGDRGARSGGRVGALGQPQLRGPGAPAVRANFLMSPMLVVAFALVGRVDIDLERRARSGSTDDGKPVFLRDIWPSAAGDLRTPWPRRSARNSSASSTARVFEGDAEWQALAVPEGSRFAWDADSTYVQEPPFFQGLAPEPARADRHRQRAGPRPAWRLGHHRPHLAGRRDPEERPGREVPAPTRRGAARLEYLRCQARQSRRDDAGHLRKRADQESTRAHPRGRLDQIPANRRRDELLRRRDGIRQEPHAAGPAGRQGIWHRLIARLGRQGHHAARREGRHRRELRAATSLRPSCI